MVLAGLGVWVPGPDDPVCEPGQVVEVDHCSQGQLPEERIGRQIDEGDQRLTVVGVDANGDPVWSAEPEPAPVVDPAALPVVDELAYTGTSPEGWVLAAVLVASGMAMVRASRRGLR